MLPWLAGQFVMGAAGVVDQILLAHMPSGNLAAYGYANQVMALALTLSATVIGRAFLPVLAAEADERLRLELTRRWARRFFWLGALGAAALMWVAEPAVALLFERGNFTRADTAQTSALLRLMALQWLLYLVGTVWVQWTLARGGRLSGLLWAALAGTGAKLAVSPLLVAWLGWGAEAICVGLAAATVGYWLALKASVWRCIVKVGGRVIDNATGTPAISVIVPCYNVEAYIDRALQSLRGQTFEDFEIIAVDDGSTDDTGARLRWWAEREPRLRIHGQENRGLYLARLCSIAQARGTWVTFMDADDELEPGHFVTSMSTRFVRCPRTGQ